MKSLLFMIKVMVCYFVSDITRLLPQTFFCCFFWFVQNWHNSFWLPCIFLWSFLCNQIDILLSPGCQWYPESTYFQSVCIAMGVCRTLSEHVKLWMHHFFTGLLTRFHFPSWSSPWHWMVRFCSNLRTKSTSQADDWYEHNMHRLDLMVENHTSHCCIQSWW
jgi:hypothetical protein